MEKTMEKIVALCNNRGFIYPGSQIYGGLANTWDYGNLGVELKNNVKKAWWQKFVTESPENVGVDCAILMNPRTWIASGHLASFSDPLMDCKACGSRYRADQLIESYAAEKEMTLDGSVDGWTADEMMSFINKFAVPCPSCGKFHWTDIRIRCSLPFLRQVPLDRYPSVQPDVQDIPGCYRGFLRDCISSSRDCSGYFCQLQECPENFQKEDSLRYMPGR